MAPAATVRDVFISHPHNSTDVAKAICHALEQVGISCWMAPRDIAPGQKFEEAIVEAIATCRTMVLVFSHDAARSPHVRNEVACAFKRGIPIIPFRVNDASHEGALEYYLGSVHWIDAFPDPPHRYHEVLCQALRRAIQAQSAHGEQAEAATNSWSAEHGKKVRPTWARLRWARWQQAILAMFAMVLLGLAGWWIWPIIHSDPPGGPPPPPGTVMRVWPGIDLVSLPPGAFVMGSPEAEEGRYDDESQHPVEIGQAILVGMTEITQGQWRAAMGTDVMAQLRRHEIEDALRPLYEKMQTCHEQCPMVWVSWEEAEDFCNEIEVRARVDGLLPKGYVCRLPTEAEWEYACRAGAVGRFHGGDDVQTLGESAWYAGNSGRRPYPDDEVDKDDEGGASILLLQNIHDRGLRPYAVAGKRANAWGLHDMHGSVWEWCQDSYEKDLGTAPQIDPLAGEPGKDRAMRGGGWRSPARDCRSAMRGSDHPRHYRDHDLGFRIVLAPMRPNR